MSDVAEYIASNYYNDTTLQGISRIRNMLAVPGVYFEGLPDQGLVLVYITLSDEGLDILKSAKTPEDFKNGFSERLMKHPGHHIYVFRMVTEGQPSLRLLRELRMRIMTKHQAKSFSWHDNHQITLHTFEARDV